jgi:hypothetical protein
MKQISSLLLQQLAHHKYELLAVLQLRIMSSNQHYATDALASPLDAIASPT